MLQAGSTTYKWIGLFIALALPVAVSVTSMFFHSPGINYNTILLKELVFWALLCLLFINIKFGERESIAALGFRQKFLPAIGYGALTLVSMVAASFIYRIICAIITKSHPAQEPVMKIFASYPAWLKLLLSLRAGFTEEIFFRAYAISRLQQLTGNKYLAIFLPLTLFALGHIGYGTVNHVLGALVLGIVLTFFFVFKRNLWANILAHSSFDFVALLLAPVK